jgi:hypothetical protein
VEERVVVSQLTRDKRRLEPTGAGTGLPGRLEKRRFLRRNPSLVIVYAVVDNSR